MNSERQIAKGERGTPADTRCGGTLAARRFFSLFAIGYSQFVRIKEWTLRRPGHG